MQPNEVTTRHLLEQLLTGDTLDLALSALDKRTGCLLKTRPRDGRRAGAWISLVQYASAGNRTELAALMMNRDANRAYQELEAALERIDYFAIMIIATEPYARWTIDGGSYRDKVRETLARAVTAQEDRSCA